MSEHLFVQEDLESFWGSLVLAKSLTFEIHFPPLSLIPRLCSSWLGWVLSLIFPSTVKSLIDLWCWGKCYPAVCDTAELNGCTNVQGILFSHLSCSVTQQRIQRLCLSCFCSIHRLDARVIVYWNVLHTRTSFFHNREDVHILFCCGLPFDT